ncbi:PD-(D/E)XK nuclease family protein [Christensenellaceae bacterium OttesenSCG-928-K19]|nr:PD-(D/E)XK nuclease family protein [Christensenellaceae bacterium OttesenSCG-928-K19]
MSIEFVLGRPASKREEYLVGKIAGLMQKDPLASVLVIVPPQATYATECMLLDHLGTKGMMGLGVMSISRVAQRVLEEVYGGARQPLGAAGKSMVIHRILKENAGEMKALSRMRLRDLLPPLLSDLVTEMKQLDVTAELLRGYPAQNPNIKAKFEDIAFLLDRFAEQTEGLYDTEDRLETVIEHIHEADFLRGAYVFIHGFDMYNAQTVRFITEVMKTARQTVLSFLYADSNAADSEVYGICNENRMRFFETAQALGLETKKIAEELPRAADILHIEKNVYAFPAQKAGRARDVSISYAKDMREEADGVAAQIAWLAQKRGYRFDEIAVVCGNAEDYLPLLEERFSRAGIPCYTGKKRTVLQSGLADFVLSAFALCKGRLRKDAVLTHVKTGYCDLEPQEAYLLQNYAYSNIRDGFAFLMQFDGEAEAARQKLARPIEAMRKVAAKARNARELIGCVTDYMDGLGVREKLRAKVRGMREAGLYESADFTEQAYERLQGILEQAAQVLGEENSGARIGRVLKAGMAAEQVAVIPPAANEVLCADIAGTWLPDIRALFVLGANEGVIPSYAGKTDILTEEEREIILGGIKGLEHTGSVDKQRLAVVKALSKPREKLFISCVRDGKMQPSTLLDRLHEIFDGIRENNMADSLPLLAQNAWAQAAGHVRELADGGKPDECGPVLAAVMRDREYAGRLKELSAQMKKGNRAAGVEEYANGLYGDFAASATRIEQYYACPYQHFMTYGIKAYRPQEYEVDNLDVGRFAHGALDRLAGKVKQDGRRWEELPQPEFDALLAEALGEAKAEHSKYALNKHNETVIRAVSDEVRTVAQAIRHQCAEGAFQPEMTEHYFDLDESGLHGVVDRIDTAEVDGQKYYGIVDYKTGKKEFELSRMYGGMDLQLFIYVLAVRALLGGEYALGGANYMRVYGAMRERGQALEPLYRMRGIQGASADAAAALYGREEDGAFFAVNMKVLKANGEYDKRSEERYLPPEQLEVALAYCERLVREAKGQIKAGENAILPSVYGKTERACRYCDYGAVCMFREEQDGARQIEKLGKEELLQRMKRELEDMGR